MEIYKGKKIVFNGVAWKGLIGQPHLCYFSNAILNLVCVVLWRPYLQVALEF